MKEQANRRLFVGVVFSLVFVAGILVLAGKTKATDPITATWIGGTGYWSDPSNWDISTYPANNGDTYNVFIDGGDTLVASVVNLDLSVAIDDLTIDYGDSMNVQSSQNLTLANSGTISGTIVNSGLIRNSDWSTIDNYGTIYNDGNIENLGHFSEFINQLGGTIDNDGRITGSGINRNYGTIDNKGSFHPDDGMSNNGTIDNWGTFNISWGLGTSNNGTIDNKSGSTFTIYDSYGFFNDGIINNEGTINYVCYFVNREWINNYGTIDDGGIMYNYGTIDNSGTWDKAFDFTNYGIYKGTGTFEGTLDTGTGMVAPGSPVGTMFVDGDYILDGTGTLEIEIGGFDAGESDLLDITGTASLTGGTIDLLFVDGYDIASDIAPGESMVIEILRAGNIDSFVSVITYDFLGTPPGFVYEVYRQGTGLFFKATNMNVIFVDADATGNNDGTSWADAYNYLQDALAVAVGGNTIWVAEGVYKPDQGAGVTPDDRSATFQLVNGVTLRGGYGGQTILSGDIGTPGDNSDNSYHVIISSGMDASTVLDSFTIRGGNANGSFPDNQGAGMYNDSSNPTVANCTFSGNISFEGGGMYNTNSSPIVSNCTFVGNSAAPWGTYGGGMRNWNSNPILTNCTFSGNSAGSGGGGIAGGNGAIMNCTFTGNTAGNDGGGILGCNGAITNCIFRGNSAGQGGGIAVDSSVVLTNCTFSGNSADSGGGIYNDTDSATLTNCILWGNAAQIEPEIYDDGTITVTYSVVEGGWSGTGNINACPSFDVSLRLLPGSPCIDAGDNTAVLVSTDLDGNPRILDGDGDGLAKVDMGAYEFMNTPTGTDVVVLLGELERPITVVFAEVTESGETSLTMSTSGPTSPAGSNLVSDYYDITTTASFDGDKGVSIDIDYSEISFECWEEDVRLYHVEDGEWVDVTDLPVDTENNIISGTVSHLSLFAIFEPPRVDIDPDTLNLKSKGKWITCYVELPVGLDVADIDVSTVELNGVQAQSHPTEIGDHDGDGVADLMVKFDKDAVQETLEVGGEVLITVTGELSDGTAFEGHDTIRVID